MKAFVLVAALFAATDLLAGEDATDSSPPAMTVTPTTGLTTNRSVCGESDPGATKGYSVCNVGGQPLTWTASKTQPWVKLSKTSGTLDPWDSVDVVVSVDIAPKAKFTGPYTDTITFTNTTNNIGSTTRSVRLAVHPLVFRQHPAPQTVSKGQPATFWVTPGGTEPFTYQWQKNGVDLVDGGTISGARTKNLTVSSVAASDAGSSPGHRHEQQRNSRQQPFAVVDGELLL